MLQESRALLISTIPCSETAAQAGENTVLVQCAISDRPSNLAFEALTVEIYADVVKVIKRPAARSSQQPPRSSHQRGKISGFSRKSRKRMIEQLAKLRSVNNGFFVTLTYPDDVPHSAAKAKRDFAALRKRLARRFPSVGGIWRLELKPRLSGEFVGQLAPHFHILLFGWAQRETLVRMWIALAWSRIVYETDNPPRKVRTQANAISSRKHAARYCSKYAAKEEPLENCNVGEDFVTSFYGRRWASFGALDCAAAVTITISAEQAVKLRRLAVRWLHGRGSRFERRLARGDPHNGFSILGLGDLSTSAQLFDSTIMRMLLNLA